MYIFFLRFFAAVVVFTDTFKTLSKDFCSMKTYYLQVRIQNHWTVPLTGHPPWAPTPPHFYFLPYKERYFFTQCRRLFEKFCATNSIKKKCLSYGWGMVRGPNVFFFLFFFFFFNLSLQTKTYQQDFWENVGGQFCKKKKKKSGALDFLSISSSCLTVEGP